MSKKNQNMSWHKNVSHHYQAQLYKQPQSPVITYPGHVLDTVFFIWAIFLQDFSAYYTCKTFNHVLQNFQRLLHMSKFWTPVFFLWAIFLEFRRLFEIIVFRVLNSSNMNGEEVGGIGKLEVNWVDVLDLRDRWFSLNPTFNPNAKTVSGRVTSYHRVAKRVQDGFPNAIKNCYSQVYRLVLHHIQTDGGWSFGKRTNHFLRKNVTIEVAAT